MTDANVTTGVVAFSNVDEHEVFRGQSTGRYSVVITMDEAEAAKLEDLGVRVKEYEGRKQRKYASKYKIDVIDTENNPIQGEIPWGSKVRVLWKTGPAHPEFGVPTYVSKIRVVEFAEGAGDADDPEDF